MALDIYSLLNSKAIGEHCRKINHKFNSLEMAYIINENRNLNIYQKHDLFNEIISSQPDMELEERLWNCKFDSLFEFLKLYMAVQNKYIAAFYRDEPNCVYSYKVLYTDDRNYCVDGRLYSDFEICRRALWKEIKEFSRDCREGTAEFDVIDIVVKKQWLSTENEDFPIYVCLNMDSDLNPKETTSYAGVISEEHNHVITMEEDIDILLAFEGLWPEIPTPFKKGDILVSGNQRLVNAKPFVLDRIPYWDEDGKYSNYIEEMRRHGDITDLHVSMYGVADDGNIYRDHGSSYIDLEYYDEELIGAEKFLISLSNYIKGTNNLELLLRSYDAIKNEQRIDGGRNCLE